MSATLQQYRAYGVRDGRRFFLTQCVAADQERAVQELADAPELVGGDADDFDYISVLGEAGREVEKL